MLLHWDYRVSGVLVEYKGVVFLLFKWRVLSCWLRFEFLFLKIMVFAWVTLKYSFSLHWNNLSFRRSFTLLIQSSMFIMTVAVPLFALLTIRASRFLKKILSGSGQFFPWSRAFSFILQCSLFSINAIYLSDAPKIVVFQKHYSVDH